jgi:hypothetical protein
MEAAENHASHNLAVLGKGVFVVILQRWECRCTFRNPLWCAKIPSGSHLTEMLALICSAFPR